MIGALYLAVIGLSALGVRGLVQRFSIPVSRQVLLPVTVVTTVAFLLVDALGIWRGWFATPLSSTILMLPGRGALDAGLPIEEIVLLAALAALVVVLMGVGPFSGRVHGAELTARRTAAAILCAVVVAGGATLAEIGGEYTAATAGLAAGAVVLSAPLLARHRAARARSAPAPGDRRRAPDRHRRWHALPALARWPDRASRPA